MPETAPHAPGARGSAPPALWVLAAGAASATAFALLGLFLAVAPVALWALAGLAAAGLAVAFVRVHPLVLLGGVLASMALMIGGGEGTQVGEAIATALLVLYVPWWYGRQFLSGQPLLTSGFDIVAMIWGAVTIPGAIALGLLFGADPMDFRADLIAALPFAFYFPIRDACARERHGAFVVAGCLMWFGAYSAVSNAVAFQTVIQSATAVWEIADARFITGETSITAGLLLSLASFAAARRWPLRLVFLGATAAFLGGLIMTKSRGFWVSAVLGIGYLWLMASGRDKRKMAIAFGLGSVGLYVLAATFFADQLILIVDGTLRRFATLATASTQDISLVNRFAETAAAMDRIYQNPILGHGWGVQVERYNIAYKITYKWAFLHNGYVALWFKTGLWGLATMLILWIGAIVRATQASRHSALTAGQKACAIGAASTMVAFTLVANSSNPFSVFDQMLVVVLLMGMCHGLAERARFEAPSA